ncbi:MAG: hypothetical protein ACOC90_07355 [Bacteroidota bacterium]
MKNLKFKAVETQGLRLGVRERQHNGTKERKNEKRRGREVSRDMPWHVSSGGRNDSMGQ